MHYTILECTAGSLKNLFPIMSKDPPALSRALEWNNTLRDRCSHISGLLVKTFHSLRALMKSALPHLITTAASRALYLRRLRGSRSDRSCHQLDHTSHCAESFFIQLSSRIPVIMLDMHRLRDAAILGGQRRGGSPAPPSALAPDFSVL